MWVSSLSGVKNLACDQLYTEKNKGCRESTDNIPVSDFIPGLPYGNSWSVASIRIDMLHECWGELSDCGFLLEALPAKGLWQAWVE